MCLRHPSLALIRTSLKSLILPFDMQTLNPFPLSRFLFRFFAKSLQKTIKLNRQELCGPKPAALKYTSPEDCS